MKGEEKSGSNFVVNKTHKKDEVICTVRFLLIYLPLLWAMIKLLNILNPPPPAPLGPIDMNYAYALNTAMQFFDIQKSGKLDDSFRIPWRGDSGLQDGSDAKLDLSKGMYDAGDHMKFGFPMAYSATMLSWAILEYGDQIDRVNQFKPAVASLQWITDYLINAHPFDNVLYVQVGDPETDHDCWDRPEQMTEKRYIVEVNTTYPGTDVSAETAAAMASASLVFKTIHPMYSATLLKHAKQLFDFADKYRKSYSISIPQVQRYYNSSGYEDELLWAATWLYHATGNDTYLKYVTVENVNSLAHWGSPTWFDWNNKHAGTQVLLSRLSFFGGKHFSKAEKNGLKMYKKAAEAVMCGLLPDSPNAAPNRTEHGLIWVTERNPLQHSTASAFLATIYSDYMISSKETKIECGGQSFRPSHLRDFSISQVDYILGGNPLGMSYLIGHGDKYPKFVHHRGASIPVNATTGCKDGLKWLDSAQPNPNVAYGALVGGPFLNETYIDARNNSMQGEPTTYNSALIVGLLSSLVSNSSMRHSFTDI